jgi:AcrR family transcriptional regulator
MIESPSPKRGRPPRPASAAEDARAAILAAAGRLFAEKGYEGVSMRAVAAEAGCALGALYTVFPNKRALLRDIWEGAFSQLLAAVRRDAEGTGAAKDRLRALLLTLIRFWQENPDHYRSIFLIQDQVATPEEAYFVDQSQALPQMMALAVGVIEAAQSAGAIAPGDPVALLEVLFAGTQGVALLLISVPEFPWRDAGGLPARMVDTLLAGIAPGA